MHDDDSEFRFSLFEDYFERDIEKRFTADIACCDLCHDEFLSVWPLTASVGNYKLDRDVVTLATFYDESLLQDEFSRAEYEQFIKRLSCPRCGNEFGQRIWPYSFPFNVPRDFELTAAQVGELAESTPFLLLEHAFCRKLLETLRDLSQDAPLSAGGTLFRGRPTQSIPVGRELAQFDLPPKQFVQEGRYNHAGNPVLYLASDAATCQAELRGLPCLVVEVAMHRSLKVLDLTDPYVTHQRHNDLLNCLVYSALVSAKQDDHGLHKPHYVVSRFVADCARASGFDAIKYPSTRRSSENFNLVIVNAGITLSTSSTVVNFHRLLAA